MNAIAIQLGLSGQALSSVENRGCDVEKALDELRHRLGLQYPGEGKMPVNQTAFMVGFF
jgi:hypothetical protein